MQKPIIIARQDFSDELVETINRYGTELPMFVMADIMEEALQKVRENAQQQYNLARQEYEKALATEREEQNQSEEKNNIPEKKAAE